MVRSSRIEMIKDSHLIIFRIPSFDRLPHEPLQDKLQRCSETAKATLLDQSTAPILSRVASPEAHTTLPPCKEIISSTERASTIGWVKRVSQVARLSTRSLCNSIASLLCCSLVPRATAFPRESGTPRRSLVAWSRLAKVRKDSQPELLVASKLLHQLQGDHLVTKVKLRQV